MNKESNTLQQPACAVYARVSLDRQAESVEHQVSLLREFVRHRELGQIPDEFIYKDTGISATKHSIWTRPAMMQLLQDAEDGLFQVVLFKGISRFARSTHEALDVLDRLKAKGLRVISYEESYDSAQDNSNFLFTIHSAVAEYEAEKTAIRVRLGNKEKAKQGMWTGMPPFGYELENRRLKVKEDEAEIVKKIFDLYVHHEFGTFKVAEYLNERKMLKNNERLWSRKTVGDILKNEVYLGHIIYNKTSQKRVRDYASQEYGKKKWVRKKNNPKDWVVVENSHEQLIDENTFKKAQKILQSRRKRDTAPNVYHPLTGVLFCGKCGEGMVCQKRTYEDKQYRYYICKTYHKYGRAFCQQANVNADDLENYVVEKMTTKLKHTVSEQKVRAGLDTEKVNINRKGQLKKIDAQIEKLSRDTADLYFERGNMNSEQYRYLTKRIKDEMDKLIETKQNIEQEVMLYEQEADARDDMKMRIQEFLSVNQEDTAHLRQLIHYFIEKIVLTDNHIDIYYRFSI